MAEADPNTISATASSATPESQSFAALPTMDGETTEQSAKDAEPKKESEAERKSGGISLRIWPPTQRTRDAVVNRLIETLSTPSILSKRYGTLPSEDATAAAKSIEEEAYGVASAAVSGEDDGIEILQVYSKEISKRMLDSVKARAATTVGNAAAGSAAESGNDASAASAEASKEDAPPESEKSEA